MKSVTGNLRKQPALRDVVAYPDAEKRQGFLLLYFKRADNREYHAVFVHNPSRIAWPHTVGWFTAAEVFLFILAVMIRFKQHETSAVYAIQCGRCGCSSLLSTPGWAMI